MCGNHQHDAATPTAETSAPESVTSEATESSCCGGHAAAAPAAPAQDGVAECPVMPGSMVVTADAEAAGLYRDYNGERYWFCCAACGPLFDAAPAKYAAA